MTSPSPTRRRTDLAGLMAAEGVSLFGSRMTFVALPWLVLVTTGSATKTGVVAFAEMLPYVIACAIGGPLIDRLGPRRIAITMDSISVVAVGSIALLVRGGALSFGLLVAMVGAAGLLRGLSDTSKRVVFPHVVADARTDLTRATAIHDGLGRLATLVGAPLAGVLVAVTDAPTVLLLDALSFGCAAVLVATFVHPVDNEVPAGKEQTYLGQLRQGVAYVRADRLVLAIMLMLFFTNLADQAYLAVFVPVWANEFFGSPVGLGLASGAFAAGAVAGNLAYAALAPRLPRLAPFAVGILLGGAPRFLTLAFDAPLWTVIVVAATAGVGLSVVNPILGAVLYERIPMRLLARVQGMATALAWAGIPLGSLLGGWLTDGIGLRDALLVAAAAYLAATLMPLQGRVWREMDRRPQETTPRIPTRSAAR